MKKAIKFREKPLISVVIPTHNRSALLKQAILSVLAQTHQQLEIIVVDDASTENVHQVIASIANPRIQYIRHEFNKGGSASRNSGILSASGEYIAFLDDDDEWVPEKIQEQLNVLEHYDAVLCSCFVNGKSKTKKWPKSVITLSDLRRGPYAIGGTGVLMARAAILKDLLFDESLPIYQDWDMFIRIGQRCDIAYLNNPLVKYNEGQHERISTRKTNSHPSDLEDHFTMLEKQKEFLGPVWYNRHAAGMLLSGFFKHRRNKLSHLAYTFKRCGGLAVIWVLSKRVYQKLTGFA